MDDQRDDREDQQQMNQKPCGVEHHKSSQPCNHEHDREYQEHWRYSLPRQDDVRRRTEHLSYESKCRRIVARTTQGRQRILLQRRDNAAPCYGIYPSIDGREQ